MLYGMENIHDLSSDISPTVVNCLIELYYILFVCMAYAAEYHELLGS